MSTATRADNQTHDIVTADATCGQVQGRRKGATVLFAGIPYAEPPLGNLRFKAARTRAPFETPYQAFKFGPAAPQEPSGGMTDSANVRWSEDCLSLNVSTPACDDEDRAVLVWIHGGAYRTGQGAIPWYAGGKFNANGNIVVVSINYRLGALGFTDLSHLGEEYATSAVNGTLDQITALKWVRDNIRAFGGNPDRVTIAGESAGGFSVCTLLGCTAAEGLFQRAIPQSGGAEQTLSPADAKRVSSTFLRHLAEDDAIGLEAVEVGAILAAQAATIAELDGIARSEPPLSRPVPPFYPAHGNPLLPAPPLEAIATGQGSKVAVLTGSNHDETTLWGYGKVDQQKLERIANNLGGLATLPSYREVLGTEASPEDIVIALTTDSMFTLPAIHLAQARAEHTQATWLYLFNWQSRAMQGRLGATHALEIPFAFDNLDKAGVDVFLGPGDSPQAVADVMHNAWISFINDGNPGWDPYDEAQRTTMVFDTESAPRNDPLRTRRLAWQV